MVATTTREHYQAGLSFPEVSRYRCRDTRHERATTEAAFWLRRFPFLPRVIRASMIAAFCCCLLLSRQQSSSSLPSFELLIRLYYSATN